MTQAVPDFPVTLQVAKRGDLRFLGHHDFARAVARALRRAGVAVRHSEGFHPRPKLRLPEPLPVGVGSDGERFVVALKERVAAADVARRVGAQLPRGLELVAAADGALPEPRDAPVELVLSCGKSDRLAELLVTIGAAGDALAAAFERIEGAPEVRVRLRAGAGVRPSIGRFLAALKPRLLEAGVELAAVDRTAPSLAAAAALQSPALFPPAPNVLPPPASGAGGEEPEGRGDDEGAPCTR